MLAKATAEAQQLIQEAETEAAAIRAEAQERARNELRSAIEATTKAAEVETSAAREAHATALQTLRETALSRLAEAEALIFGRIVNEHGNR